MTHLILVCFLFLGNGKIDFMEFSTKMVPQLNNFESGKSKQLREAFKMFDIDGNGQITRDEIRQVMKNPECF